MTEVRRIIWLHGALAVLAFTALLGGYFWRESRPEPWPFPPERSELVAKINDTRDIEHLRKISLLLLKGSNDLADEANKVVNDAIRLVLVLFGSIALIAAVSAFSLLKHVRKAQNWPVG